MYEPGFFAFTDRSKAVSKSGDPLELIERHVDFEAFRPASGLRSTAPTVRKGASAL